MNRSLGIKLSRKPCPACHAQLTVHEEVRGGFCHRSPCQLERVRHEQNEFKRVREAHRQMLASNHAEQVATSLGLNASKDLLLGIIPVTTRQVTPLPGRRRRPFLNRLREVIRKVFATGLPKSEEELHEEERSGAAQFRPEPSWVLAACATCRGFCCRLGAATAFVDEITIRRYILARPHLTARDVFRAYAHRIPKRTAQHSCIYHGAQGCTLPRPMRAHICNTFHCRELDAIGQMLSANQDKPMLLVAANETEAVRSRLLPNEAR